MKYDLGAIYMEKNWDHYMFLENYPPTPPLSQH